MRSFRSIRDSKIFQFEPKLSKVDFLLFHTSPKFQLATDQYLFPRKVEEAGKVVEVRMIQWVSDSGMIKNILYIKYNDIIFNKYIFWCPFSPFHNINIFIVAPAKRHYIYFWSPFFPIHISIIEHHWTSSHLHWLSWNYGRFWDSRIRRFFFSEIHRNFVRRYLISISKSI